MIDIEQCETHADTSFTEYAGQFTQVFIKSPAVSGPGKRIVIDQRAQLLAGLFQAPLRLHVAAMIFIQRRMDSSCLRDRQHTRQVVQGSLIATMHEATDVHRYGPQRLDGEQFQGDK
ncbi:MAG TPA: hypothetical protein VM011_04245, partial [Gammaproteobacteria bacterium]|nr:hypothetical protein [Gammaproteobacteria bacterium]